MGYAPSGVTGDAIKMDKRLQELKKMREYLLAHPEEKNITGMTLQDIEEAISRINDFEFLS